MGGVNPPQGNHGNWFHSYHDKLSRGASYGAVVSSINQDFTQDMSQVAKHNNQVELSDNFEYQHLLKKTCYDHNFCGYGKL